eukprot:jgi/Mesen1/9972/ME000072S09376
MFMYLMSQHYFAHSPQVTSCRGSLVKQRMDQFHFRDFLFESSRSSEECLEEAARLIGAANSVVAFTGAGISVESGIPDFRSANGLWSKFDPAIYCNYAIFLERPELFWEMARDMESLISNAKPNPAHSALVELESMGKLSCIITQNVDNLHQEVKVPLCKVCDGILKMDVILFGESLPREIMEKAMQAALHADVMLVVGTSLQVSPANQLTEICKVRGGKLIIVNTSADALDEADVGLQGCAGEVLPKLLEACRRQSGSKASSSLL